MKSVRNKLRPSVPRRKHQIRHIGTAAFGLGLAAGLTAAVGVLRRRAYDLRGKTVVITGGSRGFGLIMARQFMDRGAKVAICARDAGTLQRAAMNLRQSGNEVLAIEADITNRENVIAAVEQVRRTLGPIDILINNAGTICVGPAEVMTDEDFSSSIDTHFWGPYFFTMAVLPEMKLRRQGRIVNISSIGGKISVPHLLPYSVGKFALTAFSKGLRSEVLRDNIYVTTVCPGLMRTGSPRNAQFKGDTQAEYAWFSISDALPLISMDAERAARQVLAACVQGRGEIILSVPAKVAVKLEALFPNISEQLLGILNRLLPSSGGPDREPTSGKDSFSRVSPSWVTALNERAARRNNQIA